MSVKILFFVGIYLVFQAIIGLYFGFNGCCTGIFLLLGLTALAAGFSDVKSNLSKFAGIGLIELGILFFLTIFALYNQDNIIPYDAADQWKENTRATFQPVTKVNRGKIASTGDFVFLAFLGFASIGGGIFLLNPPMLGIVWDNDKNPKGLQLYFDPKTGEPMRKNKPISNDGWIPPPSPSWSLENNPKDWDIDQEIREIMNADTNLRALGQTNPDLIGKIQTTLDYYNPNAGVLQSWAARLRAEGRTKLLKILNEEQIQLIEQAATFERKVMEGVKTQVEHRMFLAKNAMELFALKTQAEFNRQAFGIGMKPDDLSDVNKTEALTKIKRDDDEARIKIKINSAIQYKKSEDTITDGLRKKRENLLIELDALEARTDISEKTKAAWKIDKENEAEHLRRRIEARDRKAVSDEESFL